MRVSLDCSSSGPTLEGPIPALRCWEVTPALTVLDGPRPGECVTLDERQRAVVLGRSEEADVVIRHPTVSRRHVRLFVEPDDRGDRIRIVDLDSCNGTSINGYRVRDSYLSPGDKIHVGDVLLRFDYLDPRDVEFLQRMAHRAGALDFDALTGLRSRSFLEALLGGSDGESLVSQEPISILMIDLDHFKRINDTFGHAAGDAALRTAARAILSSVRGRDEAIRYGGEEIVVVLPVTTSTQARAVAERIQATLRTATVPDFPPDFRMTASIGVGRVDPGDTLALGIERADQAVYHAKQSGRDRIVFWPLEMGSGLIP